MESRLLATVTIHQQWYGGTLSTRIAVLQRHILAKTDQLKHVADKSACARVYAALTVHSLLQAMAYNLPRICLRLGALSIVLDQKVYHYLEIAYYSEQFSLPKLRWDIYSLLLPFLGGYLHILPSGLLPPLLQQLLSNNLL